MRRASILVKMMVTRRGCGSRTLAQFFSGLALQGDCVFLISPKIALDWPYLIGYYTLQVKVRGFWSAAVYPEPRRACLPCSGAEGPPLFLSLQPPPSSFDPGIRRIPNLAQFWCNVTPFRINTYKSVSKQRALTPFRMNTYKKHRGVGSLWLTRLPTLAATLNEPSRVGLYGQRKSECIAAFPLADEHQRIHFLEDLPGRRSVVSKSSIHETNRTVFRRCPSSREKSCVMKSDDAIFRHVRAPVVPILFDRVFSVISVDQ